MTIRSFEYLAATEEMGITNVPGDDSFTRALIFALESLVKERLDGRFTTVELLNKIRDDAPHFPKDQTPILKNREKKHSAGRIMLHPLQNEGSDDGLSGREAAELDVLKGHALTLPLLFDFPQRPSPNYIESLGRELNEFFQRNKGVNRVRWGGMRQSAAARAAKSFQATLRRNRRASTKRQQTDADPPTPSSIDQHSPRIRERIASGSPDSNHADISVVSLDRLNSNDESQDHVQDLRSGRKRRKV